MDRTGCCAVFRSGEDMLSFITSMIFEDEVYEGILEICTFDTAQNIMTLEAGPTGLGVNSLLGRFYNSAQMYVGGDGAIVSFTWKFAGGLTQWKGTEEALNYIVFRTDGGITTRGFVFKQSYQQVTTYLPRPLK